MLDFSKIKLTTNRTIRINGLTNNFPTDYSEKALCEIFSASDSSLFWEWSKESNTRLFSFGVKMENEKQCSKCQIEKPIIEFYPRSAKCKECYKTDVRINRKKNKTYYKLYEQERAMLPHRVEIRKKYQETHPEIVRNCKTRWSRENPKKLRQSRLKYIENNPEKHKTHLLVGNAVRNGTLVKQPCEICGETNVHGHHDDYSKPLEVRWLCPKHHSEHHAHIRTITEVENV